MSSPFFPSRFSSTFGNPMQNGLVDPRYGQQLSFSPNSNNYFDPREQNQKSSLLQQMYGINGKMPMNQMGMGSKSTNAQNPYLTQLQRIRPDITDNNLLPPPGMEQQDAPINPIDIGTKLKGLGVEPQVNRFTSNPLLEQLGIRENKEAYDKWKTNKLEPVDLYKNYQNEGFGRNRLNNVAVGKESMFKLEPKPDMGQLGGIEAQQQRVAQPQATQQQVQQVQQAQQLAQKQAAAQQLAQKQAAAQQLAQKQAAAQQLAQKQAAAQQLAAQRAAQQQQQAQQYAQKQAQAAVQLAAQKQAARGNGTLSGNGDNAILTHPEIIKRRQLSPQFNNISVAKEWLQKNGYI